MGKGRVANALAALSDPKIIEWSKVAAFTPQYILPVYYLGYSPLPEADTVTAQIVASGDKERISILGYAYRNSLARNNAKRAQRLREVEALIPPAQR